MTTNAPAPTAAFILASASPRRRALLRRLGHDPLTHTPNIEEIPQAHETPSAYVMRLASEKATHVAVELGWPPPPHGHPAPWVLAADTTVVLDGQLLEKPHTPAAALTMLTRLRGRTHQVLTGVAVADRRDLALHRLVVSTDVTFAKVSDRCLERYVRSGEPLDKAGAYGVQGIGTVLVREVHGSYSNVVGLPLAETLELLLSLGAIDAEIGATPLDLSTIL